MAESVSDRGNIQSRSSNSTDIRDGAPDGSTRGRSFSFLRRSSSKEPVHGRSASVGKRLIRRNKSQRDASLDVPPIAKNAPRLPSYQQLPNLTGSYPQSSSDNNSPPSASSKTFGYNPQAFYQRRQMDRNASGVAVHSIPEGSRPGTQNGQYDPYARTESMTNRGRYSYASSAVAHSDSPRRVRRRKDPTPLNVLVVGAKSCGKTSFIEFLRTALIPRGSRKPLTPNLPSEPQDASFTSHYLETELEGERIGLTLYDSKGLERHLVDLQLRETASFLESKFQETFNEEQKVMRATGVRDTHIHCVFLILDPSRLDANIAASSPKSQNRQESAYGFTPRIIGGLDEDLDVEIIRTLQGKTTVIPVISKADTVTTAHMAYLKRTVWDSLKKIKFDPLEALAINSDGSDDENDEALEDDSEEDDDTLDGKSQKESRLPDDLRVSHMSLNVDLPDLPMSIISPDMYDPGVIGRRFPWGFADPYNSEHCDFVRLKETVFSEWRAELRSASRERWYEGWRTNRLKTRGIHSSAASRSTIVPNSSQQRTVGSSPYSNNKAFPKQSQPMPRVVSGEIGVAVSEPQYANGSK